MIHIVTTNKQDSYMCTVKKSNRLIHQHNHHQTNIISGLQVGVYKDKLLPINNNRHCIEICKETINMH